MKFLLVEDNAEFAEALTAHLSLDGHVVDHASNLSEAMAYSETQDYDLLLDIMLPDGDGRRFLERHRAADRDTPVMGHFRV